VDLVYGIGLLFFLALSFGLIRLCEKVA